MTNYYKILDDVKVWLEEEDDDEILISPIDVLVKIDALEDYYE